MAPTNWANAAQLQTTQKQPSNYLLRYQRTSLACPVVPCSSVTRHISSTSSSSRRPSRAPHVVTHAKGGSSDDIVGSVKRLADSVIAAVPARQPSGPLPPQAIHCLIFLLVATWFAISLSGPSLSSLLAYSNHQQHWWTVVTDGLHSSTPPQLASSLFFTYMFGRSLENAEGPAALIMTYVLACIGGCIACSMLLPRRALLLGAGRIAALFGLYCGATLFNSRKRWHWQRALELVALTPFVLLHLTAPHNHLANALLCMGISCGAWVPLLGGLLGAAAAALGLAGSRAIVRHVQQKRSAGQAAAQQQEQRQADVPPVESIVASIATLLLKRLQ